MTNPEKPGSLMVSAADCRTGSDAEMLPTPVTWQGYPVLVSDEVPSGEIWVMSGDNKQVIYVHGEPQKENQNG